MSEEVVRYTWMMGGLLGEDIVIIERRGLYEQRIFLALSQPGDRSRAPSAAMIDAANALCEHLNARNEQRTKGKE